MILSQFPKIALIMTQQDPFPLINLCCQYIKFRFLDSKRTSNKRQIDNQRCEKVGSRRIKGQTLFLLRKAKLGSIAQFAAIRACYANWRCVATEATGLQGTVAYQ